jgi:hypothetical protein
MLLSPHNQEDDDTCHHHLPGIVLVVVILTAPISQEGNKVFLVFFLLSYCLHGSSQLGRR